MTFATISELLAAGVGGEKVREYVAEVTSGVGGVLTLKERADAAILAVANDRGTCPDCRQLLPENGYCFIYDRAIVGSNYLPGFGCSLFARKDTP